MTAETGMPDNPGHPRTSTVSPAVVETVVRLILRCHRCNKPFKDEYESDEIVLWTAESIARTFPADMHPWDDALGWKRLSDRILCDGCWIHSDDEDEDSVELGPLPALEAAAVTRAQLGYLKTNSGLRPVDEAEDSWEPFTPEAARSAVVTGGPADG